MTRSRAVVRCSVVATVLLGLSACSDASPDTLVGGPGAADASAVEEPGGVPPAPAWGVVTQAEADRLGEDASGACKSAQSLAAVAELRAKQGPAPRSFGGYTTDYAGLLDWNRRMAGMAAFPDPEDRAVPYPPGLLTICWYAGSFEFAEDTETGRAAGTNIVVVFDDKGGRRVPIVSNDPIGMTAPSLPQGSTDRRARAVSHAQMPGVKVVPGQSLSEKRAAAGRPDPVPGGN